MKLLENISEDLYKADQENLVLKYLQENKIMGNEDIKDEPNLFHCYWFGQFLPVHLLCIKSLLATQNVDKIYIWVPDLFKIAPSVSLFKNLQKIEIKQFNKDIFDKITNVSQIKKDILYSRYNSLISTKLQFFPNIEKQYAYASDLFRFIILNVYGGIYFDMDNVFLRNLNDIKIKRYLSQWGSSLGGNASILKLEKDHNLIEIIMKKVPMYFYPQGTFELDKPFDITIMHRSFFDPLWPEGINIEPFNMLNDFFKKTNKIILRNNFFNGAFTYHWHNRWDMPVEENSPYSQLLSQF